MPLADPSPLCTVNASSTLNGVNVTAASTVTIALADTTGVKQWAITCVNTDDLLVAATVTAGLTVDHVTQQATFTAPAVGSALLFQSVVNQGKDANGVVDPSFTTTFAVFVLTATGYRVAAFNETTQGSAAFGWITKVNAVVRNNLVTPASAGDGIHYSAGVYSVFPDPEGSIVVTAAGVKVGVLAFDAEHGNRGNGALHSVADGTHNGFMSSAHYTLVNGATNAPTSSRLAKRGASGECSFGALDCGTFEANGVATFDDLVNVSGGGLSVGGGASIDVATVSDNLYVGTAAAFGTGSGVVGLKNATVNPSGSPSGGGMLYAEAGALKWRGSSGTVTTIAPA